MKRNYEITITHYVDLDAEFSDQEIVKYNERIAKATAEDMHRHLAVLLIENNPRDCEGFSEESIKNYDVIFGDMDVNIIDDEENNI